MAERRKLTPKEVDEVMKAVTLRFQTSFAEGQASRARGDVLKTDEDWGRHIESRRKENRPPRRGK